MQALYNPFKITYENDTISDISFRTEDAIWSKNFKRALASALQVQGSNGDGAFIVKEVRVMFIIDSKYISISVTISEWYSR